MRVRVCVCVRMALTNIPVTLVGYRDYNGIVKELHLYNERDLMERGKVTNLILKAYESFK